MPEAGKLVVVTFVDGTTFESSFSHEVKMNPKLKIANKIIFVFSCFLSVFYS